MIAVLDACAVIAFLRGEPGAEIVEKVLTQQDCVIHAVNLAEVYVDALRRGESKQEANEMVKDLGNLGLEARTDLDPALWKRAAEIKASGRIAFADCFALSLTERVGGRLYTADRREMQRFADSGEFEVTFIR